MSQTEINILLTMKNQIDASLRQARDGMKGLANDAESANKSLQKTDQSMSKSFKDSTKPLMEFRTAFNRITFLATAAFGTLIGLVKSTEAEFNKLTEEAIRLGVTVESLSMKKFGFNIATDDIKGGVAAMTEMLHIYRQLAAEMAAGTTSLYGKAYNTFQTNLQFLLNPSLAKNFSWNEMYNIIKKSTENSAKKIKETSDENISLQAGVLDKIKQLSLDEVSFKRYQTKQEIDILRAKGVEERTLNEYGYQVNKRIIEDQGVEYLKMQAKVKAAQGDTLTALQWEQDAELTLYKRKDASMVDSFKKAQAEIREQARLTELGLKNDIQITKDFNKEVIGDMKTSLSSFINDAFHGELKSAADYFRAFGDSLIQAWSNTIAEMMVTSMMGSAAGGGILGAINPVNWLSGIKGIFHQGGVVRAHSGMAVGSDEVPIIAQSGEGILSRKGMNALGGANNLGRLNRGEGVSGSGQTIYVTQVIHAWDAKDVSRNIKSLSAGIIEGIRKNSDFRLAMKQYA